MKVGFIGDDHGRGMWNEFILDESIDHWVLMGDLADNDPGFIVEDDFIIENIQNAIDFKLKNIDKVTLLIGNHSNSYIHLNDPMCNCSRFRGSIGLELSDLYNLNIDLFQNAWQYKDVIATHAGIQDGWFLNEFEGDLSSNIADQLNNPKTKAQANSLFDVGACRGGWADVGGIFWADISELYKPLKGYTQVVGHNRVPDISYYKSTDFGDIYFIDCLGSKKKFLTLEL